MKGSSSLHNIIFNSFWLVLVLWRLLIQSFQRREEKERPGLTVSTIPERDKIIKYNIVETTAALRAYIELTAAANKIANWHLHLDVMLM